MKRHFYKALLQHWTKMLVGRSYWHGATGLGSSFRPGELQDYYRDYSPKIHWQGAVDECQLPLVQEPGGPPFHHPLVLIQKALGHWSCWLRDKESSGQHREDFLFLARWLVNAQESQGSWDIPSMHKPLYTAPYSSLVQGQAISVLARAFSISSDEAFLTVARRGVQFMLRPLEDGGLSRVTEDGLILEEYPYRQPKTVLNGWISALFGLYDMWILEKESTVRSALDSSVAALLADLPKYNSGYWSLYDSSGTIASPYYHKVHISQLKALELSFATHATALKIIRDRFEEQLSSSLCFTRAFALKALQKLRQPPPFIVIQTSKTHSP